MPTAELDGESRVQEFLTNSGLRVGRFSKPHKRQNRRTPDFCVYANDELAFYCELKTAQQDERLDKQLAAAPPLTLVGGSRPDATPNRISSYVHSAVGQFDSVDPTMDHPNVLAIVNGSENPGFPDLVTVLRPATLDDPPANRASGNDGTAGNLRFAILLPWS